MKVGTYKQSDGLKLQVQVSFASGGAYDLRTAVPIPTNMLRGYAVPLRSALALQPQAK